MSATVEVRVLHGAAPGLGANATSQTLRLKRADSDLLDDKFLVGRPTAGTNYSWRKTLLLVVTAAPDNSISNVRFFSDGGTLGTGRTVLFGRAPAYTQATAADEAAPISAVDLVSKTSVAPEVLVPGQLMVDTDPVPTAGTGQDHVELQLAVDPTADIGNSAAALVNRYRYTEA